MPSSKWNPTDRPGTLPWLVAIMRRLLGPDGCPWDREQTLQTLRPYLLEECFEVLDALDEGDPEHHCEELGDLLFQIVFQAELARLDLERVIRTIGEKLIRRHPHVFGDLQVRGSDEVLTNWERIKAAERVGQGQQPRTLDGVPRSMPALQRSFQLTRRAARVGFDWPQTADARNKVSEELRELDEVVAATPSDAARVKAELGDLLFAIAGWARRLDIEPEEALREAAARFEHRYNAVESLLAARGKTPADCPPARILALWNQAKKTERNEEGAKK